jgi:hypothetical protein
MEGVIGKPLAAALKSGRADFNQRFKLAQQQYRGLAADDWFAFVKDTLNPVAEIVAAHDESAVPAVIDVLYDQALPLVAQRWLGTQTREPVLAASYKQLLAALAPALVRDPQWVSAALLNALHQLCHADAARAQDWTQRLARIAAKSADVDAVLALGRVLAWRVGVPAYRAAALQAGPGLPPLWAQQALDLPTPPDAALWQALVNAPALRADETSRAMTLEWLGWCGGYRGLAQSGGAFAVQPQVGLAAGRLATSDGETTWWLAADGYGAQLVRMGSAADWPLDLNAKPASLRVNADGSVNAGKHSCKFVELESARAAVWHEGIIAVTLGTSYQVALLRCP